MNISMLPSLFPFFAYGVMGLIALRSSRLIATATDHRNGYRKIFRQLPTPAPKGKRTASDALSIAEIDKLAAQVKWAPRRLFHQMAKSENLAAGLGLAFTSGGLLVMAIHGDGGENFLQILGAAVGTTLIGTLTSTLSSSAREAAKFEQHEVLERLKELRKEARSAPAQAASPDLAPVSQNCSHPPHSEGGPSCYPHALP